MYAGKNLTYLDQRNWRNNVSCVQKNKDDTEGGMHINESLLFLVNQYIQLV